MGIDEVPERMGWREAIAHARTLRSDPGSMLAAAMEGWEYPFPRELAATIDLFDLQYAKTGAKDRKPYQRPFKIDASSRKRRGNAAGRTPEQVMEILRAHGHGLS